MLQATNTRTPDRVKPKRETPVRIASAVAAATILTVNFDQPVVLKGTPAYTTDVAGAAPVPGGAAMTSPTQLRLTFDADISLAASVTIPFEDAAIRSAVGGFVADSTFTL